MREMIILFRVGFPSDNAISNGLQGESITHILPIYHYVSWERDIREFIQFFLLKYTMVE